MTSVRLAAAISAAAACAAVSATSAVPARDGGAAGSTVFTISGRGWGHGVGMSQWGAYGMARRGTGFAAILAHYYRGTTLGRAPVARVRVLLAEGRKTVTIGSAAPFTVRDATGTVHEPPARRVAFGTGLRINVDGTKAKPLPGPLVFSPTSAPLELGGRRYRGTLEVAVAAGAVRVVNTVRLEQYLWGVVPDEMPSEWPAEALKAQAVVARSYALAVRRRGPFDLYADVRSQVYGGFGAEEATTTAAVNATAGQVLLFGGRVATTFFFSTSGGRTARIEDVWPGSTPTPYLVSVADPLDVASPHHRWGPLVVPAGKLASALGTSGLLLDARTTRNASGRAAQLVGVTPQGEVAVAAATIRQQLGLRSTWFSVGALRLDRPTRSVWTYGGSVRLTGLARGLGAVTLESRRPNEPWRRGPAVRVAAGAMSVSVRATAPADYRLAATIARTPPVRVAVAPRVGLSSPGPGTLAGTVKPVVDGARVTIQRRSGTTEPWRVVTTVALPSSGRYETALELGPGSYRARIGGVGGFAPGVSAPLVVAGP